MCVVTSLWQDEVCGTRKAIMRSGHVSLSRVMGGRDEAEDDGGPARLCLPLPGSQEMP